MQGNLAALPKFSIGKVALGIRAFHTSRRSATEKPRSSVEFLVSTTGSCFASRRDASKRLTTSKSALPSGNLKMAIW